VSPDALGSFLASVRKTSFIDYLDPLGEEAAEALERRLQWAQRSLDDPAYADEARFLLEHAAALRAVVRAAPHAPSPPSAPPPPTPTPAVRAAMPPDEPMMALTRLEDLTPPPTADRHAAPARRRYTIEPAPAEHNPDNPFAPPPKTAADQDAETPLPPPEVERPSPPSATPRPAPQSPPQPSKAPFAAAIAAVIAMTATVVVVAAAIVCLGLLR
jgi:hypothetical protein